MSRRPLVVALLASACAHGVSRPNPPGPPDRRDAPYAGRVVISSGELRERVETYESVWTRRLAILGATAHITYDDDRAIIDLYGITGLDRIAPMLVDPGGWLLDGRPFDASLVVWLPPTPGCGCSGRVRVAADARLLCAIADGDHALARGDARARLPGVVHWKARSVDKVTVIDVARPARGGECPTNDLWPDSIVFDLPATAAHDDQLALVLGLAGGSFPDAPHVDAVTPARGQP